MSTSVLKVGYSLKNITPPLGIEIPGQQRIRISEGIIAPLFVRILAIENEEKRAVIVMCDAIRVSNKAYKELQELLSNALQVDPDCVYIHATHTHTAVAIDSIESCKGREKDYMAWQQLAIKDCAEEAFGNLQPCKVLISRGIAEGVGFLRRYKLKDGNTKTNPTPGDPNILCPAGTMDNSVQLVRFVKEDETEILLVNFGTHPDTIGGKKYHPDWPAVTVDTVKRAFGEGVDVIFLNGCQGNAAARNRMIADDGLPKKSLLRSKKMARIITGEVLKIYDEAVELDGTTIQGHSETALVGKNEHKPEEEPLAREIFDVYLKTGSSSSPECKEICERYGMSRTKAARILKNMKVPDQFQIPVYGLRIGKIAFIGFPGEPFCEIGIGVKEKSPFPLTVCSCCTNGSYGYFPTAEAFATAGYEREASRYSPEVAEVLENTALRVAKALNCIERGSVEN